jgi:hypothetical protein
VKQSAAWVLQARSDLAAARAAAKKTDASTYCQSLAKYQQVTEKSVKGMVAALVEIGIPQVSISGSHTLRHEMNGLDVLRRKKREIDKASLASIDQVFKSFRAEIEWLCVLAPSGPSGLVYPRNTEYPFNDGSSEGWTAPAALDSFTLNEVNRAHSLAWALQPKAARFVSLLHRSR